MFLHHFQQLRLYWDKIEAWYPQRSSLVCMNSSKGLADAEAPNIIDGTPQCCTFINRKQVKPLMEIPSYMKETSKHIFITIFLCLLLYLGIPYYFWNLYKGSCPDSQVAKVSPCTSPHYSHILIQLRACEEVNSDFLLVIFPKTVSSSLEN